MNRKLIKLLADERGIALITSLLLMLIALVMSMVMLYMVDQGTRASSAQKKYKNSVEAAVGNVQIVTMDLIPSLMSATGSFVLGGTIFQQQLNSNISALISPTVFNEDCLNEKLTKPTPLWDPTRCAASSRTINAKQSPDVTVMLRSQLPGLTGGVGSAAGFRVYTKILSTTIGSSDLSGRNLEGQATTGQPPQDVGAPYLYRIEVTGERDNNPLERANLTVLYAY